MFGFENRECLEMVGRKPGTPKTGGRKKGTPNKITAAREAEIAAFGLTPLEYMLKLLRDDNVDAARRDEMAKAAAPYCHPRLSTVDAKVNFNQSLAEALDEMDGWGKINR
jgi:hypothetical protein